MNSANESVSMMARSILWNGDWNHWKRGFKAMACLNGLAEAVEVAEIIANGAQELPIKADGDEGEQPQIDSKLLNKTTSQTRKLGAVLTLSLMISTGVQHSIIIKELEDDEDGIAGWIALVRHFCADIDVSTDHRNTLRYRLDRYFLKVSRISDSLRNPLVSVRVP